MSRFYDLGSSAWHDLPVDKKELRKKVASLRRALMYVHKGDESDDRDAAIHNILNGRRRMDIVGLDTDSLVDVPCDRCGKIKWKTLGASMLYSGVENHVLFAGRRCYWVHMNRGDL